ncbi:hypothetical protein RV07_GL001416 [Enterococcus malodoratus]|nr:hypothetical protein RV07_GL001416 [Enterococcus malodoratus]
MFTTIEEKMSVLSFTKNQSKPFLVIMKNNQYSSRKNSFFNQKMT